METSKYEIIKKKLYCYIGWSVYYDHSLYYYYNSLDMKIFYSIVLKYIYFLVIWTK